MSFTTVIRPRRQPLANPSKHPPVAWAARTGPRATLHLKPAASDQESSPSKMEN